MWLKKLWAWVLRLFRRGAKEEPVTVVEAVGTAAASRQVGLAAKLEQAMSQAVLQALAEGITDPQVIRDRKLAARTAVKVAAKS